LSGQCSVAGLTHVAPVNCENNGGWAPTLTATPTAAVTIINWQIASRFVTLQLLWTTFASP
jgi:hypothetical protein